MLANFLIGLREGLEAALVVSILLAYLVKSDRRKLVGRVWVGVAVAIVISLGFGAALTFGPRGLTFAAQEGIGGSLSIIAVGFVTWMIFWMARAARGMAGGLRDQVDRAAETNSWSLAVVALLAVGREGLETALFLWAATEAAARDTGATTNPLLGAALGIVVAIVLGYLMYRGAIKINLTRFFTWTGAFLIIVAAGVLAYGIHDLQEAGFLPGLNTLAFDISRIIPPSSWYGTLLKGIFNFSPATTVLEATAWVCYFVPTMTIFLTRVRARTHSQPRPATPVPASTGRTRP
ncbi:iron uptake transporter permease EfeU [uncultured Friedmanniella sp.]|uniref:iron uptake transporter permease EfeU n=1 Tax=uncultured Friedmanniella sp. TaxID=335381 RepID=UPI0035CAF8BC